MILTRDQLGEIIDSARYWIETYSDVVGEVDDLQEKVDRGFKRLTEHFGHDQWTHRIDLVNLNQYRPSRCVAGQLWAPGDWLEAMAALKPIADDVDMRDFVTSHGFGWGTLLTKLWQIKIACALLD